MKSKTTVRVIARTFELQELADRAHMSVQSLTDGMMKDFDILSGRAAGVCYMPEDYFESELYSEEKSLKRAESTARRGHASVFDHAHMTLLIETNKMMAMILNSLGVYTTSEKSARYTKMKPETQEEKEIYTKWIGKLQKEILKQYTFIDDDMLSSRFCKELGIEKSKAVINGSISHIKDDEYMEEILSNLKRSETLPSYKLAQENARYMISVFTPTVMEYTLSYRQLFLIIDYLDGLSLNLVYADDKFSKKLKPYVEDLKNSLMSIVDNVRLHDTKNQYIRFLEAQHVGHIVSKEESRVEYTEYLDIEERLKQKKEVIGDSYTLVYNGSLAMLAQAQRHRTLRYTMCLQEPGERGFYVPEIVKKAGLEKEWLKDINSLSAYVPQGTMVRITEQGIFEDFALKCKERMCGRAQLEIMKQTEKNVQLFIDNQDNLSYENKQLLKNITYTNEKEHITKPCARCMYRDFTCTDGCNWGAKEALNRLI